MALVTLMVKYQMSELSKIFSFIQKNKIGIIDTAQMYGDSEKRISSYMNNCYRIITKFSLDSINKSNSLQSSLESSLKNLSIHNIDTFMVHSFNMGVSNKLTHTYDQLEKLKENGLINKIWHISLQ